MKRNIFIGLLVVLLILVLSVVYIYNKPHRDVTGESAAYELTLEELHNEFSNDEAAANTKYFNKVVVVSGTLTSLKETNDGRYYFVIETSGKTASGEIVDFEGNRQGLIDKEIKVKGLFIGYDDLLEEIQLSECTIIN